MAQGTSPSLPSCRIWVSDSIRVGKGKVVRGEEDGALFSQKTDMYKRVVCNISAKTQRLGDLAFTFYSIISSVHKACILCMSNSNSCSCLNLLPVPCKFSRLCTLDFKYSMNGITASAVKARNRPCPRQYMSVSDCHGSHLRRPSL